MKIKKINDIFRLKSHNIGEITPKEIVIELLRVKKFNTNIIIIGSLEFIEKFQEMVKI
jgi:hypothetical protein